MATHTTLFLQPPEPEVLTYNHPRGYLLDGGGGRRREYFDVAVPLFRASIEGDLKAAKVILQDREYLLGYSITENKETPLHVAAAGHSIEFVSYLVNMMTKADLELQNRDGNTAFCIAAIVGNVCMVEIMCRKNPALPTICGRENMMPLHLAAMNGNSDMVTRLYALTDRMNGDGWRNDQKNGVFFKCIHACIFNVALQILLDNVELLQDKRHIWDVLQVLARNRWAFLGNNSQGRMNRIKKPSFDINDSVTRPALKPINAVPLLRLLWKRIMVYPKDDIDEILRGPKITKDERETYPSQILFMAAEMNNKICLVELIREYPDLIWKRNDDGQTIFHVAVAHRHPSVYSLLHEIGSMKDLITPITDQQGNNILHLVGKNPEKNGYIRGWVTPSSEMFSELAWYKEVERMLPPAYRGVKNAAGETPLELFTKSHKDLFSEGMKSMHATIAIYMVVAVLVCTIGFSVVLQIPGGFDQNNGSPLFLHRKNFIAFLAYDAMSFLFATTSIILFLPVLLPAHIGNMFYLHKLWLWGQMTLLSSILCLLSAFTTSFAILYHRSALVHAIYTVGFVIMGIYGIVWVYIGLNVSRSIHNGANHHFRPKIYTLYRKD